MSPGELHLVFDPPHAIASAARACEADVFHDRYGISADQMSDDYDPYDDVTVWLALLDARGEVVAGSRLIPPNGSRMKSLNDISRPPWSLEVNSVARAARLDLDRTWDVATMFQMRESRRPTITPALCYGIVQAILANNDYALVAILDRMARSTLARWHTLRVNMLPGATRQIFMNTPNDPTFVFIEEMLAECLRVNPSHYETYTRGAGLQDVHLPDTADFVLKNRLIDIRAPYSSAIHGT